MVEVVIEVAEVSPFFLLSVSGNGSEKSFDIEDFHRLLINQKLFCSTLPMSPKLHRPFSIARLNIPFKEIKRFKKMSVPIDDSHRHSSFFKAEEHYTVAIAR